MTFSPTVFCVVVVVNAGVLLFVRCPTETWKIMVINSRATFGVDDVPKAVLLPL